MQFTELKKSLETGEVFPIYILEGEDAYFRALSLETLKSALIKEPTLNAATFDGGNQDMGEVLASLTAAPFFSDYRMTVIKDFYPKADAVRGGLKDFLENPVKGSVLVVVNERHTQQFSFL